jgi:hypothetical protein
MSLLVPRRIAAVVAMVVLVAGLLVAVGTSPAPTS